MQNHIDVTGDDALGRDDVMELLHRLSRREVSAQELRAAAHARIAAANDAVNAVVCDVEIPPATDGPFRGIPTAVKDNQDLTGYPTRHGSSAGPGFA